MKTRHILMAVGMTALVACGAGEEGDECATNDDCAEGLECHLHEHDGEEADHGECEAHDEDEHDEHEDEDSGQA